MKKKFKLIVPSFLTLIFCLLLIAGSTFAIFSSQAEASIEVKTGKVHVTASLTGLQAYSAEAITETEYNALTDENAKYKAGQAETFGVSSYYKYSTTGVETVVANASYKFATKGTAILTDSKTLILDKIVPGDKVTLNLGLANSSNVDVKYRVRLNAIEDNGLFDGLTVKVNGIELVGTIKNTAWLPLAANGTISDMPLEVLLPITAGNEYQEKTAKLRFTVEMVQGNAKVDEVLDLVNGHLTSLGNTNKTMWDAIQDANTWLALPENAGKSFIATNYVWNMDTDQFYAEDNVVTGQGFESRFFKAYSQADMPALADQKFGIYATGAWTGIDSLNPVNIVVGFDAGDATGITNINYDRHDAQKGQEVTIRTNDVNAELIVNAPKDVVNHYGMAGLIDIIASANSSYHEFGTVGFVKIAKGRIAIEENSNVSQVHIKTSELTNEQTNEQEITFDEIIVSIAAPEVKPTFSRDDVEIADGGTLVVALQQGTEDVTEETELDYVWLTKQGIYEQIKVSDNSEDAGNEWVNTSDKSATTKTAANEIANNITRDNNGDIQVQATVTKTVDTVVTTKTYEVKLDANRDLIVVDTEDQQATQTVVATLNDKTTNVEVGNDTFTVALSSTADNVTQIVLTNTAPESEEVIKSEGKITSSGLDENAQQAAMNENSYKNASIRNRVQKKAYSSLKQALEETNNYDVIEIVDNVKVAENIVLTSDRTTLHINDGATLEFVQSGYVRLEHATGNANTMMLIEGTGTIKNSTDNLIFRSSAEINHRVDEIIDIADVTIIGNNFSDCKLFIYSGYFNTKLYDADSCSQYAPFVANEEYTYIYGGHFIDSAVYLNKYSKVSGLTNNGDEEYQVIVNPVPYQTVIQIIYEDENRGTVTPLYVDSPTGASFLQRFYTDADPILYPNNAAVNLNCTVKFLSDYNYGGGVLNISTGTYAAKKEIDLNNHTYTFSGNSAFLLSSNNTVKVKNGTILTNTANAKIFQAQLTNVTFENVVFGNNLMNDMFNYMGANDYIVVNGNTFTLSSTRPNDYNFVIVRDGHNIAYNDFETAIANLETHDTLHLYENATEEISIAKDFLFYVTVENNVDFPTVVTSDAEADVVIGDIGENTKSFEAKLDYAIEVYNGDVLLKGYKNITDLNAAITYCGSNTYRIVLQKDLELASSITLSSQKFTIDLNGHTINSDRDVFSGKFTDNNYYIKIEDNSTSKNGKIICKSGYLFNLTSTTGYAGTKRKQGTIYIYGGTLESAGIAVYYNFSTSSSNQSDNYNFVNIEVYSGAKLLAGTKMATTMYAELGINTSLWVLNNYSITRNINAMGGAILAGNDLSSLVNNTSNDFVRVVTDSTTWTASTVVSIENVDGFNNCYIVSSGN